MFANENTNGNGNGNGRGFREKKNGRGFLDFFLHLLNINRRELFRVTISFGVTLIPRIGFVVGWTALTALFVANYGIAYLPLFFLVNAAFMILGTLLFMRPLSRIKRAYLVLFTALSSAAFIFFALFLSPAASPFFLVALFAEAILFTQLTILLGIFVDAQFTPLESERTHPIIQAGETIGHILGGFLVAYTLSNLRVESLLYFWIAAILLVIPFFVGYNLFSPKLPSLIPRHEEEKKREPIRMFRELRNKPFLKTLFFVVMAQAVLFNTLEFQYTKAVEQRVTGHEEATLVRAPTNRIFHVSILTDPKGVVSHDLFKKLERETLQAAETKKLAEILGKLHVIFGALGLLVQLFFASRFIESMGVAYGMFIHPLLFLASLLAPILKFNLTTVVFSKASFEAGNGIYKNAVRTSLYALRPDYHEHTSHFFDGFVRPLGMMLGMSVLFFFHFLWSGRELTLSIHFVMIGASFLMMLAILRLKKQYTLLSKESLFEAEQAVEKWRAIEVLLQRGHRDSERILVSGLEAYLNETNTATKIINALSHCGSEKVIPALLPLFSDEREEIRLTAVIALDRIVSQKKGDAFSLAFSRHRISEVLRDLFQNEPSEMVRNKAVLLFAHLSEREAIDFLIQYLFSNDPQTQAHCIAACRRFRDPSLPYYLKSFLTSDHPEVKAQTCATLWQFPWMRSKVKKVLDALLQSGHPDDYRFAIYAIGQIKTNSYKPILKEALLAEDPDTRFQAALSLTELGDEEGMTVLTEELLDHAKAYWNKFYAAYLKFPRFLQRKLKTSLSLTFSEYIAKLTERLSVDSFLSCEPVLLGHLKKVYELLDQHDEAHHLERYLTAPAPS